MAFLDFYGLEPPKLDPETHSKKASPKTPRKNRFWHPFCPPQNVPKSFQHRTGTPKKATQNEVCFATLWERRGSRRKLTGLAMLGLRK